VPWFRNNISTINVWMELKLFSASIILWWVVPDTVKLRLCKIIGIICKYFDIISPCYYILPRRWSPSFALISRSMSEFEDYIFPFIDAPQEFDNLLQTIICSFKVISKVLGIRSYMFSLYNEYIKAVNSQL